MAALDIETAYWYEPKSLNERLPYLYTTNQLGPIIQLGITILNRDYTMQKYNFEFKVGHIHKKASDIHGITLDHYQKFRNIKPFNKVAAD